VNGRPIAYVKVEMDTFKTDENKFTKKLNTKTLKLKILSVWLLQSRYANLEPF